MRLESPAFEDGERMPDRFGAANDNVNPPLEFVDVPDGAETLVLLMYDPDAEPVVGHPFDHWTVFNIPAGTESIGEGEQPPGTAGSNDAGDNRYFGPKPPDGKHTYVFELHALDTRLGLKEGASREAVEDAMEGHVLKSATLRGTFSPEQY